MATYTITAVSDNVRDWSSSKGGTMKAYRVVMRDQAGNETQNVEWSRKESSPPPTVGQQVEGDIDVAAQYGPKFKQANTAGGGGGYRGKPVEERRSIAMQHAQKCAVDVVRLAADLGEWRPADDEKALGAVLKIADKLFAQVEGVSA